LKNKPEILFLYFKESADLVYHLGASYIIAYLRTRGVWAEQFVNTLALSLEELATVILKKEPRIVGFTVCDANYFLVKELASRIKERTPQITIVAGGPSATFSYKSIMRDTPAIDICVQGEGEVTMYELAQQLNTEGALDKVLGISFRSGQKIIKTAPRPLVRGDRTSASLDILPSPYLGGVLNVEEFLKVNQQPIPLVTSRGCVYKCTFCNFSAMSRHTLRFHSVRRALAELKLIDEARRNGLDVEVAIYDDTFTLNKKRVEKLCLGIIAEGIGVRIVGMEMRGDTIDKNSLSLLFRAGIREINFGLESASPSVLYNVKKVRLNGSSPGGFEPEKTFIKNIKQAVLAAKGLGFKTSLSVIFGLPGDTRKSAYQTLNFLKNLELDAYSHNILTIYPGTALSRNYKKYGIRKAGKFPIILTDPLLRPLSFPYQVDKLPRLKNEYTLSERRSLALSVLINSLSGWYKKQKNDLYPEVVFVSNNCFPQRWLKEQLSLQTRFIYGKEPDFQKTEITLAVSSETSFLHPKYTFMSPEELLGVVPEELKFHFRLKALKDLTEKLNQTHCIYFIRDILDVCKLEELAKAEIKSGEVISSRSQRQDGLILDACRWGFSCSALSLRRLIVDSQGQIKVCFDSDCLGRAGEAWGVLTERFDRIYREKMRERNCDTCALKYSCSKCPFLSPALEKIYCKLKQRNSFINPFINAFHFVRKLDCLC
jgi:radical SAM superfamily enzyme YgiQ (UPF0313 family)